MLTMQVSSSSVCVGYPEKKFVGMMLQRKGKNIDNKKGGTPAYLDDTIPVMLHGQQYHYTVRAYECEILCHGRKCKTATGGKSSKPAKGLQVHPNKLLINLFQIPS